MDFAALTAAVGAGLAEVRACLLVSRDGLALGSYPPGEEHGAMDRWARLSSLGDVERGFAVIGEECWIFSKRGPYSAFAVARASVRPGVILERLDQMVLTVEEARLRKDAVTDQGSRDPGARSVVKGTKASGAAGLTAPPHQDLPQICWPGCPGQTPSNATQLEFTTNDQNYNSTCQQPSGCIVYTERDYTGSSACTTAKSDFGNWFGGTSGNYLLVINQACALQWPNQSTVSIRGNLAIFSFGGTTGCTTGTVTNGAICTVNNVTFNSVGGTWDMLFIRPYVSGLSCSTHNYDIDISNSTQLNSLKTFIYSQCTVNFGNNNASGVNTQLIGGTVNLTNQMVLNFSPTLAPVTQLIGYKLGSSYLREIANGS